MFIGAQHHRIHGRISVLNICGTQPTFTMSRYREILTSPSNNSDSVPLVKAFDICSNNQAILELTFAHTQPILIRKSCTLTSACIHEQWADEADAFVGKNTRTWSSSSFISIYIIPETTACNWAGLGYIGCGGSKMQQPCRIWIQGNASQYIDTYIHEIGHTLGLTHASSSSSEYGDPTCAMGLCCWSRCYNAPHLEQLRWASPLRIIKISNEIMAVTRPTYIEVDVPDARSQIANGTYVRIESNIEWIFIEYRAQTAPIDEGLPTNSLNIYVTPPGNALGATTKLASSLNNISQEWRHPYLRVAVRLLSTTAITLKKIKILVTIG